MGRKTGYTLRGHQWFGFEPDVVLQVRLECLPLRQPTILWENLANTFECLGTLPPLQNYLHHLYYVHSLETGQTGLTIFTEIYQFSIILHHIPGS